MNEQSFTLQLETFKGPLALLLDLIEQRKLHVNDISLATVADEYVQYLQDRSRIPLTETAQFIVVASTLLLIKSRSLLPSIELTDDEEEDIRDLEHRLRLYAHARNAARILREQWGKRSFIPQRTPYVPEIVFTPSADLTASGIHTAMRHLLSALPVFNKAPTAHIAREVRLEDVIENLTKRMQQAYKDSFKRITSGASRVEAIVSFLALLELVKKGTIHANQEVHFDDITMEHDALDTPTYG